MVFIKTISMILNRLYLLIDSSVQFSSIKIYLYDDSSYDKNYKCLLIYSTYRLNHTN